MVVIEIQGNMVGAVNTIEVAFPKENSSLPIDQLERDILIYILNKPSSCFLKSVRMEAETLGNKWEMGGISNSKVHLYLFSSPFMHMEKLYLLVPFLVGWCHVTSSAHWMGGRNGVYHTD